MLFLMKVLLFDELLPLVQLWSITVNVTNSLRQQKGKNDSKMKEGEEGGLYFVFILFSKLN